MQMDTKDATILLNAARAQHRALTRMREDLRRNGIVDIKIIDTLFEQQNDLANVIEKLQKITGQIPA